MKSIENANITGCENIIMTFHRHYASLPESRWNAPGRDFITEVCQKCEVSENTVLNWLTGRSIPQKA